VNAAAGRRFVGLHRVATLAVVALGFAALWVAGELGDLAALLAAGVIGLAAFDRRPRIPGGAWLAVQLLFLGWLLQGWLLGGRHVLTTFALLLVFVQLHRVLTRSSTRDDLYACFIAFGQLLLSSVLTVNAAWFVIFVLWFVALVWALLLTRLARAVEQDQRHRRAGRQPTAAAFGTLQPLLRWRWGAGVTALSVGMLASTLVLFFVLPRLQASFLSASLLPPVPVSGFSEQVRLGELGLVQLSDEPVMRVQLYDRAGQPASAAGAYWHGLAMDRFDGRAWSLSDPRRTRLGWVGGARTRGPPREQPWSLRQEVALEPLDTGVLFHLARATGIYGEFRALETVETEGYYLPGHRRRRDYVVYSEPVQRSLEELRELDPRDAPDHVRIPYTQLPAELSSRIPALAQDWTRGGATPADEALLIQQRLHEDFTYSLAQPSSAAEDPLLAFLEDDREGHCEYFATAMVVMLRTRGIPARIVNGFQGGEWNPVGSYWLVRQRDAHSWVEVWFGEGGWVVFDPTPLGEGGLRGRARIRLLARLGAWADYGRVRWTDVMLDYGLDNQAEGLRRLLAWASGDSSYSLVRLMLDGSGSSPQRRARAEGGLGWWVAPLVLVLLLVVLAARLGRRRSGSTRQLPVALRRAARLVRRLEARWRRAARRDPAPPRPDATALAWAEWAASRHPRLADAPDAIACWYEARFGGREPDEELVRRLARLVRASRRPGQSTSTGQKSSAP